MTWNNRRHENESTRAMVAARLANIKNGDNQYVGSANLQTQTSRAQAAQKLNVSERSVNTAKKVQQQKQPHIKKKRNFSLSTGSSLENIRY